MIQVFSSDIVVRKVAQVRDESLPFQSPKVSINIVCSEAEETKTEIKTFARTTFKNKS
jgi:hypothetical protein